MIYSPESIPPTRILPFFVVSLQPTNLFLFVIIVELIYFGLLSNYLLTEIYQLSIFSDWIVDVPDKILKDYGEYDEEYKNLLESIINEFDRSTIDQISYYVKYPDHRRKEKR